MSFDFQSSNMTDREAQAYQKKTFKRGRGKRSQRNKLPPTSCDPETTPPSTEMDPAEDKENMMNLEILGKTYSFVKNSYVCVKRSHPFITKLGNFAETTANKCLNLTSKINESLPKDLIAVDTLIAPALSSTDAALTPHLVKAGSSLRETKEKTQTVIATTEKLQPFVKVAQKVLPVETATRLSLWLFNKLYVHYDTIMSAEEQKE